MAKALSFQELHDLLVYVRQRHSPFKANNRLRPVMYVDPCIDIRSGEVFTIVFRGYGDDKIFTVVNEGRFNPDPLLDQIHTWLSDTRWFE